MRSDFFLNIKQSGLLLYAVAKYCGLWFSVMYRIANGGDGGHWFNVTKNRASKIVEDLGINYS